MAGQHDFNLLFDQYLHELQIAHEPERFDFTDDVWPEKLERYNPADYKDSGIRAFDVFKTDFESALVLVVKGPSPFRRAHPSVRRTANAPTPLASPALEDHESDEIGVFATFWCQNATKTYRWRHCEELKLPYSTKEWTHLLRENFSRRAYPLSPHFYPSAPAVSMTEALDYVRLGSYVLSIQDNGDKIRLQELNLQITHTYWEEMASRNSILAISRRRAPKEEWSNYGRSSVAGKEQALVVATFGQDHVSLWTGSRAQPDFKETGSPSGRALEALDEQKLKIAEAAELPLPKCRKCQRHIKIGYRCRRCEDQDFMLCDSCFLNGTWCGKTAHRLTKFETSNTSLLDVAIFDDMRFTQELKVFDTTSSNLHPTFDFARKSDSYLVDSPPVLHSLQPLVLWPLRREALMVGNISSGNFRLHQLRPVETSVTSICVKLHISPCKTYLHVLSIDIPAEESLQRFRYPYSDEPFSGPTSPNLNKIEVVACLATYQLFDCIDTPLRSICSIDVSLGIFSQRAIANLLFDLTWTSTTAFITFNDSRLKVFAIELFQEDIATAYKVAGTSCFDHIIKHRVRCIDDCHKISTGQGIRAIELISNIPVPKFAENRKLSFAPGNPTSTDKALFIVHCKQSYQASPPVACFLASDDVSQWHCITSEARPAELKYHIINVPSSQDLNLWHKGFNICLRRDPKHTDATVYKDTNGTLVLTLAGSGSNGLRIIGVDVFTKLHRLLTSCRQLSQNLHVQNVNAQAEFVHEVNEVGFDDDKPLKEPDKSGFPMPVLDNRPLIYEQAARRLDGVYWRRNRMFSHHQVTESDLCNKCYSMDLSLKDFIVKLQIPKCTCNVAIQSPTGDARSLDSDRVAAFGSLLCSKCWRIIKFGEVAYNCAVCDAGDFDLCADCLDKGDHCHDLSHVLSGNLAEDNALDRDTWDQNLLSPQWHETLGSLNEIETNSGCPFCRLIVKALETRIRDRGKEESLTEKNNVLSLEWFEYGFYWDPNRWGQRQARYLRIRCEDQGFILNLFLSDRSVKLPEVQMVLAHELSNLDNPISWLVRSLHHCERFHARTCRELVSTKVLTGFNVIDCDQLSIVERDFPCRYLTLSYVWGDVTQLKLLKENRDHFKQRNALQSRWNQIPTTIQDSILLVKQMGERYLWVDSLCIVQDDIRQQAYIIDRMDIVYGNALLSIIAGAGPNANSGLPGVRPGTLQRDQITGSITEDINLVALPNWEIGFANSSYCTRGWTFQELFLSCRKAIFLSNGVYLQCERRTFREDFAPNKPDVASSLVVNTNQFSARTFLLHDQSISRGPGWKFQYLVSRYLQRQLKYESDILRAFQGVLKVVDARLGLDFSNALPIKYFDASLLFCPLRHANRREGFPSFSWLGWKKTCQLNAPEVIWPDDPGNVKHPFVNYPISSCPQWFFEDTYIVWFHSWGQQTPVPLQNRSRAPYAWSWQGYEHLGPRHGDEFVFDLMGRPTNFEWREIRNPDGSYKIRLNSTGRDSTIPSPWEMVSQPEEAESSILKPLWTDLTDQRPFLHFWTLSISFLLDEYQAEYDEENFKTLALKCERNVIHGFVAVTDGYQIEIGRPVKLIVLSNAVHPQFSGHDPGQCDSDDDSGTTRERTRTPSNVLLLESHGNFYERAGIGIISRYSLGCSLGPGARWEQIILG